MFALIRSPLFGMLIPLALASAAPVATLPTEGYAMRVWQTSDGLPQNQVTCAVQTRDGYLWLGTYGGLARFDGERFEVFEPVNTPEIQDRRIDALFEDDRGTLWIGHESGKITQYRDGRFKLFAGSSGNPGERIIGIGSDENGQSWAMRHNGAIKSLTDGHQVPSLIAPALGAVMSWSRGRNGAIWLSENGQAAQLKNGKFTTFQLPPPRSLNYVLVVAASADGSGWILCDNRTRKWDGNRWTEDRGDFPWPDGSLACALELRDGTLAVGTINSGLYLIFKDGRPPVHIGTGNGLPQSWVRFLYEDREGNLWAGAGSSGLVSIHSSPFSVVNSPDQWQGTTVISVTPGRNDALWIGTDGAALYRYAEGQWRHYDEADGLTHRYLPAVIETANGEVWVGYYGWGSPRRTENDRFVRPASVDETSSPVFALLAPPEGDELLVGNRDGLVRMTADKSEWVFKAPSSSAVCAIVRSDQGEIWGGLNEGGLAHVAASGKVDFLNRKDGLASDSVQCLFLDRDGALWIGTADNGLSRYKNGRFTNLGVAHGLVDSAICKILDDGQGYLWMSTHHGIQRVAKFELNRCADGLVSTISSQIYDLSDGLPVVEFVGGLQASGCKTNDGRLWFASSKGLVSVAPTRIQPNQLAPPVVFESLLLDGKKIHGADFLSREALPPDHQRLEFRFSGLSYVAPNKVLFKYRLDGIDDNWIEAGSRRSAFYSHLPAGTYRFRVIACNNDGVWNTEGASLTFTVAPYFWQTWWFLGSCLLAVLASVAVIVRYVTRRRLQRQIERLEREQAIERERARIAQDIHDDLGSSLTRIAMLSQPARHALIEPQHAAAVLSRINATAGEVTRSLDEIVWAIDPRYDTLDSLVSYMGKFAQDLLGAANIRCRLNLPVELPSWPLTAETRHNLFLAFKEVLNNTLKHSGATEVHVTLSLRPDAFVLSLRDNGRGFDPQLGASADPARAASGHGLPNLQRRLSQIGGRCELSSQPGQGTTVSFIIGVAQTTDSGPPSSPTSSLAP